MKVLLIAPNYLKVYSYVSEEATMILPPLGLAYIASYLRANGIDIQVLDLAALRSNEEMEKNLIKNSKADLVAMAATTNTVMEAYHLAKITKEVLPKAKTAVGGPHPTMEPIRTLKECEDIDYCIISEAEDIMLELSRALENNYSVKTILGISYRDEFGVIKVTPTRPLIQDLDKLPFPARDLLPLNKYWTPGVRRYPFMTLMSSRGCPYSCTFCSNFRTQGKQFRFRSPENVLAEIDELVNKYGVKEINIIDDNFTFMPQRVKEICDLLIQRNYDLILKTGNGIRSDRVTLPMLKHMKKAGFYLVAFGIESGNPEILKKMRKGETKEQIKQSVKWAKQAGLITEGFFMFGNEGEGREQMLQTIEFAKELDLNIAQFQVYTPVPGSPYYEKIAKEGKVFSQKWEDFNAFNEPLFEYGESKYDLMLEMQQRAYREYYFRPRIIVKKLMEVRNLKQFNAFVKAGMAVAKMSMGKAT
ncbi:radical SAM protein [Candidatus Pacearchaeota archaeon]|nr:radical SAM protein [Candidatus Pacearchaeota archaeon]